MGQPNDVGEKQRLNKRLAGGRGGAEGNDPEENPGEGEGDLASETGEGPDDDLNSYAVAAE